MRSRRSLFPCIVVSLEFWDWCDGDSAGRMTRAAAQFRVALHSVDSLRGSNISIPERLAAARRFLSNVASGRP